MPVITASIDSVWTVTNASASSAPGNPKTSGASIRPLPCAVAARKDHQANSQ